MIPVDAFEKLGNKTILRIKVQPKSSMNKIGELMPTVKGGKELKVYLTDPPEDGKANRALINLIALELAVSKSSVQIASGHKSRNKIIQVM